MKDGQAYAAAYESEITEMLRVDTGCGVDLKCVVIVSGVLEEAIDGVEHLVRQ